jgi:transcriptional regulator with XRE-family HTH domain
MLMTTQDLSDKIAQLPQRRFDVPAAPPIELVAFVVRWNRGLRQWKTRTLADFACVSVSTIERIERGERVSDEALDRIAQAFGYNAGYFTTPRLPLGAEETAASVVETFSNLEIVPVGPMKTHRAVRDAARCDGILIHRPEVPETYDSDIANLQEWLDLASFVLSDMVEHPPSEYGRRDLYNDILACVGNLEQRGLTVLSGVMPAPQARLPDLKVAIISITPRLTDPGAAKRRHVMVDRRVVAFPSGPATR